MNTAVADQLSTAVMGPRLRGDEGVHCVMVGLVSARLAQWMAKQA
jgi:hypothetical protein